MIFELLILVKFELKDVLLGFLNITTLKRILLCDKIIKAAP